MKKTLFLSALVLNFSFFSISSFAQQTSDTKESASTAQEVPQQRTGSFPDVTTDNPHYTAIEALKNQNIVNGDQDGNFYPTAQVKRVEALKMILLSANIQIPDSVTQPPFPDTSATDWFAPYAQKAKEMGIVSGDGTTGFLMAAKNVNRAEFLKIMFEAFGEDVSQHDTGVRLSSDVSGDAWFRPYMGYAKALAIITASVDDKLAPDEFLTREECAEMIYKMLVLKRGGETQKMLNITEANLLDSLSLLEKNDVNGALQKADAAVFYSEQALSSAPEEGIAKAANKIARGFQELCFGYKSGLEGNSQKLMEHAQKAKELAGDAYTDDPSTQPLGRSIKQYADLLIAQIEQTDTPSGDSQ